jgi:hypothetical protein
MNPWKTSGGNSETPRVSRRVVRSVKIKTWNEMLN